MLDRDAAPTARHGFCVTCGPDVVLTADEANDHIRRMHGGHGRIEFVLDADGESEQNARTSRVESGTERPASPYPAHVEGQGTRAAVTAQPPAGAGPLLPDERPSDDARSQYEPPDDLERGERPHPDAPRAYRLTDRDRDEGRRGLARLRAEHPREQRRRRP